MSLVNVVDKVAAAVAAHSIGNTCSGNRWGEVEIPECLKTEDRECGKEKNK